MGARARPTSWTLLVALALLLWLRDEIQVPDGRDKTAQESFLMEQENNARATRKGGWKR